MAVKQVKIMGLSLLHVDGTYDGTAGSFAEGTNDATVVGAPLIERAVSANSAQILVDEVLNPDAVEDGATGKFYMDPATTQSYFEYGAPRKYIVALENVEYKIDV